MFFAKIKKIFLDHLNYKIDIQVSTEYFELKDSFDNTYKIETYLHVDKKNVVRSVGKNLLPTTNLKRLAVFEDTAKFDIASTILKHGIMQLLKDNKKILRPRIYFHQTQQIPELYFSNPKSSDKEHVRTKFFTELGIAIGGRESFVVS